MNKRGNNSKPPTKKVSPEEYNKFLDEVRSKFLMAVCKAYNFDDPRDITKDDLVIVFGLFLAQQDLQTM